MPGCIVWFFSCMSFASSISLLLLFENRKIISLLRIEDEVITRIMLLAMGSNIRHLQLHNSLLESERHRLVIVNFVGLRQAGLILLANSARLFRAPIGAMDISRRRSEAQARGQTKMDFSRPGRDAGPEFATKITQVRRPFRARA